MSYLFVASIAGGFATVVFVAISVQRAASALRRFRGERIPYRPETDRPALIRVPLAQSLAEAGAGSDAGCTSCSIPNKKLQK